MKVLILMGSPRTNCNTAELCKPLKAELENLGAEVTYIALVNKKIASCKGCYCCQQVTGEYGCPQKDDMYEIVQTTMEADCIVVATPIYHWSCTAEMKAVLDRYYGMNKYYGAGEGSLWKGKHVALLATHGYDRAYATEPLELGLKRLCAHSGLEYAGMYSVRDEDDLASFQAGEAVEGAKEFARKLWKEMEHILCDC